MLSVLLGILVPVLLVLYAFSLVSRLTRQRVPQRTELQHRRAVLESAAVRAGRIRRESRVTVGDEWRP